MPAALPPSSGSGPKDETRIGPPQTAVIRARPKQDSSPTPVNAHGQKSHKPGWQQQGPIIDAEAVPVKQPATPTTPNNNTDNSTNNNSFQKAGIGLGALATGAAALWAAFSYSTSRPEKATPVQAQAVPAAKADTAKPAAPTAPEEKKEEQASPETPAKKTAETATPTPAPAATATPTPTPEKTEVTKPTEPSPEEKAAKWLRIKQVEEMKNAITDGKIVLKDLDILVRAFEPTPEKRVELFSNIMHRRGIGENFSVLINNGKEAQDTIHRIGLFLERNGTVDREVELGIALKEAARSLAKIIDSNRIKTTEPGEYSQTPLPGDQIQSAIASRNLSAAQDVVRKNLGPIKAAHKVLAGVASALNEAIGILEGKITEKR
jgi:hypothetical protein